MPKVPLNKIIDKPRSIQSLERNRLVSWRYPYVKQLEKLIFLVIMLKENGKQSKTKHNKNEKKIFKEMVFLSFSDVIIYLEFNLDVISDKLE